MYKIAKGEGWIGSLFENDVEVYHDVDASESYEFDMWALVKSEDKWYIVGTHGCSCPSYEEMAQIELGPLSKQELIEQIKSGNYSGFSMPEGEEKALITILESAE